jgi:hypothetical protein
MQFNPEEFPVKDWKFIPSSTLGMLAREVEQAQIINLLKTLGPDSPIVPILLQGVLANSSLPNKNALMAQVQQSMQPNPQQEQMQQMAVQMQMQKAQADIAKVASEVEVNKSNATKNMVETQLMPEETKAKLAAALSNNLEAGTADDKEFERRAKIADLMLKEKSINLKEQDIAQNAEIVKLQMSKPQGTTNA